MISHSRGPDRTVRRHDLVVVCPLAWRAQIEAREDVANDPLVASWIDRQWPLVGRRAFVGEGEGVALGLPLPPVAGKRRLSFLMQHADIVSVTRPPPLSWAGQVAPAGWCPTLERICDLASRYGFDARVFGSLAWHALTGLDYLTDRSDLDFLFHVSGDLDLLRLHSALARIEADAPMRLDGELVREDGGAANWREFGCGARDVLVKSIDGVGLLPQSQFILGSSPS
ncbi:malonate decarboxylase holo-[acyl-carrier-protein] synthase [Variovorax saccharolyticus]|uniref:malonate decarboxylase holo-[acyl-carrier-protein] synthase n=1 Tax=Variovorax saccharolyticus TaxID=3053516 RepID=UPI002575356F|nr:malonate decarboxylase holo-[acyl-carrier-protein] synthase [Variovorax sp. J31P216]MDM0030128.1 malonate decarboxylase holo-[acyl-carrier-protein] synthase [Variovorax sp. J31P216]